MWKLALVAAFVVGCAAKDKPATASRSPVYEPFEEAVKHYLDLRRDLQKKAPKMPAKATPEQIAVHQSTMAEAIRNARSSARQGDIFVPSTRDHFIGAIRSQTKGTAGKPARETIMGENPRAPGVPGNVKVAVNAPYPPNVPYTTLPPALLLRLPTLPDGLEYRFVGRALILRDVDAALIVDFLPNALPEVAGA
jgi:hypothetical protein